MKEPSMLSRRSALKGLFGGTAGTLAAQPAAAQEAAGPVAPAAQPQGICVLFPQAVEGPYYFDPGLVREDITEGRPGAAIKLVLDVIEYGSCQPIANVRVDVWHADAGGIYSGYAGQGDDRSISTKGEKYLRGTQTTNAQGRVTFATVYPGWYPGRTPHIHIKALLDAKEMLTGQVYFPDALSQRIYHEREPYKSRPDADTTNAGDFIFRQGEREGGGTVLAIAETPELITASLIIAVDRSGNAAKRAHGWGQRIRDWFTGRE
jgi:protocatechuate 3,4-dioxygenase beta subunit